MHKNNFDFLRLLFAALVVVHHCYPIAGVSEQDPLYYFSNGALSYSYLGVRGFFVISGFLIFQSLFRSKNMLDYLVKRVLRIYPALFIVLLFTVLFCSFLYEGTWLAYWKEKSVWTYIPINISLIKLQYAIKGVFENNPLKSAINGSLWTIIYEFSMYLFLIPFLYLKRYTEKQKAICISFLLFLLLIVRYTLQNYKDLHIGALAFGQWVHFAILFMSGAFLSILKIDANKHRNIILIGCLILFFTCMKVSYYEPMQYFIFPPIVIIIGTAATKGLASIGEKFGDVSYGTYIYGFPIQQLLMHFFSLTVVQLLVISIPLTLLMGWLSWHLIEKNTLAKKQLVYNRIAKWLSISS